MKQFLLSVLLLASISCVDCAPHTRPVLAPQPPAQSASEIVQKSIVRITLTTPDDGAYICTGFSIGPRKFMTAAHCTIPLHFFPGSVLAVNGIRAFVLAESENVDLAVIIADLELPGLKVRLTPLSIGEDVHAMGYGYGFTMSLTTHHIVELLNYRISDEIYPGTVFLYPFMHGMSGGPVYDANGSVVGVIQRTTNEIGYGVNVATMIEFLVKASS